MSDGSKRIAYWDNLKAILIFLVVLGHFLLPVSSRGRSVSTVYYWIYVFHMPAFVFVSGYFSKSYVKRPKPEKVFGFLLLYVIFKVLIWLLSSILDHQIANFRLFYTNGAPWYMFCMFLWYLAIPSFAKIKPALSIPFTILIGLLMGTDQSVSLFFGTSLLAVFFPFFLLGFHFQGEWLQYIKPGVRALAAIFLLACAAVLFFFQPALEPYLSVIYGSFHYAGKSFTVIQGMTITLIWYAAASLMTGALLCLTPKSNTFFTYIGTRTLSIYILHRLLRDIFGHFGLYDHLGEGKVLLLACVVISLAVTFLTSGRHASDLANRAFHLHWLEKPDSSP